MPDQVASRTPERITRIVVRIQVGEDRMAASDDPLFLRLRGPHGREFRLDMASGKSLRRGALDEYVLGAPKDADVNVNEPALNDPNVPPLDASKIEGVELRKALNPIPNVRGVGEMDDRLEIEQVSVELHVEGRERPVSFSREGPLWLGLVCGLDAALERDDES